MDIYKQSILKEISSKYSLKGLMLKLKSQYFGHLMWRVDSLEKTLMLAGTGGRRKGDDRGWDGWWHHWLDAHESEWTPGVGDGQGGPVCCNSWGRKELDTTKRLNWTELYNFNEDEHLFIHWATVFVFFFFKSCLFRLHINELLIRKNLSMFLSLHYLFSVYLMPLMVSISSSTSFFCV